MNVQEYVKQMPEFMVLDEVIHSKRHDGKSEEAKVALVDFLRALPVADPGGAPVIEVARPSWWRRIAFCLKRG